MYKRSAIYVVPIMLASVMFLAACDKKPQPGNAVVEEDIVLDDGSSIKEWIVDEIVPFPRRKPPEEVAGARPSKEHVWVPGEWRRNQDMWVWESGRWLKPPHRHASWMKGHWREQTGKWHWTPGHWVVTDRTLYATEMLFPPEPLAEKIPPKPAEKNHWIAGHWDWDGKWYWVSGYWTNKPTPEAVWVQGHWDEYGLNGGYRWIGGHWRVTS